MKNLDLLAKVDFGSIIAEAISNNKTQTGRELLEKYSVIVMKSPVTYALVNSFMNESKKYLYDSAVYEAASKINSIVEANKISWSLATVCESINNNNSKYNYINRTAAAHVMELLEGRDEAEVISYIKAGALKGQMFCEGIRNIVKSVYKDQVTIIETSNYTCVHPISYVEINEGNTYFALGNRVFYMNSESQLFETHANEKINVSPSFRLINETLNAMEYDGVGSFQYTLESARPVKFIVGQEGFVTRVFEGKEEVMNVDEFRENNRLYLMTINPAYKNRVARVLEGIAQVADKYENIVLVEEVSYITTSKGKQFMIIEGKDCINFTLLYSHNQKPFTKNYESIVEALNDIKAMVQLDLTNLFEERINAEFEAKNAAEQQRVTEALEKSSIQERRERIAALTEAYKNDPATLAVLSRVAMELNDIK